MEIEFSMKKIMIIVIFLILILVPIGVSIYFVPTDKPEPVEIVSNDNSFKITIPSEIKFERKDSQTLDIYSAEDEMILTSNIMEKENKREINLYDVVGLEVAGLYSNKTSLENVSEINKLELPDCEAYKYSYNYFDSEYNDNFYVEVVWISTNKKIYALDLEVITKNQEKYKPLFSDIINSFTEIN